MVWIIVAVIAGGALIGVLAIVAVIRNAGAGDYRSSYRPGYKDVVVRDAVDVRRQQYVSGDGEYFSGDQAEHTIKDDDKSVRWHIVFADIRTGKQTGISFSDCMIAGRGKKSGSGKVRFNIDGDALVSKEHFTVYSDAKGLRIKDCGSKNGTYVNGHKLKSSVWLNTGDRITAGSTDFTIQIVRE